MHDRRHSGAMRRGRTKGAQNGLAIRYSKGLGVRRDVTEAYLWRHLAADRFEPGLRRERAIVLRDMVAAFMTPGTAEGGQAYGRGTQGRVGASNFAGLARADPT